jgi:predicted nucleic acid-binding protein
MILVDSNVVLDILSSDQRWFEWSLEKLSSLAATGPLLINEVIYAEVSARVNTEAELNAALDSLNLRFERSPQEAFFRAGRAFLDYRKSGGTRSGVLPDLFIGAHAEVLGCRILTRDKRRFGTYFPTVGLIMPE